MTEKTPGDAPSELDERLVRRDRSSLPGEAFLRVQSINRGKSPTANIRYYLTANGDVFESGHSDDSGDWQTPFDQDWPGSPTRSIGTDAVDELRRILETEFPAEEPYQANESVEGGVFVIITARIGRSRIHEVIYAATLSPTAREILRLANGDD